jgi:hypothetical protein
MLIYSQHSPWIYKHDFLRHKEHGPPKYEPSSCSVKSSCSVNNMYVCDSFLIQLVTPGSFEQVNSQTTWLFLD